MQKCVVVDLLDEEICYVGARQRPFEGRFDLWSAGNLAAKTPTGDEKRRCNGNTLRPDLELPLEQGFGASAAQWEGQCKLTKRWLN
jgi:hypothetical protein